MATRATKPIYPDMDGMPWRMLPSAKDYLRLIADEGEPAGKIARFALVSLAKDLDRQGVSEWKKVEPRHYEAWVRRRHEATLNASPMEREVFCGCHARMDEFFCGLEAMAKIPSNPADGIIVNRHGVVIKRKDSNPALDQPIRDFLNDNHPDRESHGHSVARSSLRAVAGAMLARDINAWPDLTAEKLDEIAKGWVEESRAAGKPTAVAIQSRMRAIRVFGDYLVQKGQIKVNPAEDVTVAASGRVTMPKDHDPKMFAQAQDFVASLFDQSAPSSHITIATVATKMTRFMCGECGLQEWREVSPAHYADFLREAWARNPASPVNAMFQQSTARKLLAHLKAKRVIPRDPSEDVRFSMKGDLKMGRDHCEKLPRGAGQTGLSQRKPLQEMPPGFAREAVRYHAKMVRAGMVSSLVKVGPVLPELAEIAHEQGCKSWADVKRPLLVSYGKKQFAELAGHTAAMKLSVVRSFFTHLDQVGAIPSNPIYGVKVLAGREVTEPDKTPTPEMEQEVHAFVRRMKPGDNLARMNCQRELFRLGTDLTAKGRATWAEVTREDLIADARERAPAQSRPERRRALDRLKLFCADLAARKVVPVDLLKQVRAEKVFAGIPPRKTPGSETSMSVPAVGELVAPEVVPPAKEGAAPGIQMD